MQRQDRILFLDIDGPLNTMASSWCKGTKNPDEVSFEPRAVDLVNRLVAETDARIVVTSCWVGRCAEVDHLTVLSSPPPSLIRMFRRNGIDPARLHARWSTWIPVGARGTAPTVRNNLTGGPGMRCFHPYYWLLSERAQPVRYAILDDEVIAVLTRIPKYEVSWDHSPVGARRDPRAIVPLDAGFVPVRGSHGFGPEEYALARELLQ